MTDALPNEILIFSLNTVCYGIPLIHIKEITAPLVATRIPHAPPHIMGLANFHGTVIPVFNLALFLNQKVNQIDSYKKKSTIILMNRNKLLCFYIDNIINIENNIKTKDSERFIYLDIQKLFHQSSDK